jgi:hypothetical protein
MHSVDATVRMFYNVLVEYGQRTDNLPTHVAETSLSGRYQIMDGANLDDFRSDRQRARRHANTRHNLNFISEWLSTHERFSAVCHALCRNPSATSPAHLSQRRHSLDELARRPLHQPQEPSRRSRPQPQAQHQPRRGSFQSTCRARQ